MAEVSKAIDKAYLEKQFQDYTETLKENFVDSEFSADSTYPVQNKVIMEELSRNRNLLLNTAQEHIGQPHGYETTICEYFFSDFGKSVFKNKEGEILPFILSFDIECDDIPGDLLFYVEQEGDMKILAHIGSIYFPEYGRHTYVGYYFEGVDNPEMISFKVSFDYWNDSYESFQIKIKNVKLEIGEGLDEVYYTVPWTPAPEDGAATITVDSALDPESTNPVQNKVVTEAIQDLNDSMPKQVSLTGDVTGTGTFDEDGNVSVATKIDGVVGGRNLVKDTGDLYSVSSFVNRGVLTRTVEGVKLSYTNEDACGILFNLIHEGIIKNNEIVTLSFDYRGTLTEPANFVFMQNTPPNVGISNFPNLQKSETEWKHYRYTFSSPEANVRVCYKILIAYIKATSEDWFEIKKESLKLEKGSVETDWTPAIEDTYYILDSANIPVEQRRNTFRGKNLGSVYTDEQKAAVAAGTFKDLFIGDYWVINGVTWRIVDINYWLNTGDTPCTTPHLVIMPDGKLYDSVMNSENTTEGGYVGSEMYKTGLNQAKEMINYAFGESFILNHREYLTNAVTDGHPSGVIWNNSEVELPNEIQMYGCMIFATANIGATVPTIHTIDKTQFSLMRMYPRFINPNRNIFWLRDPVNKARWALVDIYGISIFFDASRQQGVRPVFGVIGTPAS